MISLLKRVFNSVYRSVNFIPVVIVCLVWCSVLIPLFSDGNKTTINPELVGKGIISTTDAIETGAAFTPDGKTFYFTRRSGKWADRKNTAKRVIYRSTYRNGNWQKPQIASFSGEYSDSGVSVSPDGKKLFFISRRPVTKTSAKTKDGNGEKDPDIWMCVKTGTGWGEPVHLGNTVNSPQMEFSPVTAANGNLYFASMRPGGFGQGDLYMSRYVNGKYQEPVNLGKGVNSKTGEWNLYISPDESYMVFEASGRKENMSIPGDLYFASRKNGRFGPAVNMAELNTTGSNLLPAVSPDRKYFYYSSSPTIKSGSMDIYRVDLSAVISKYIGQTEKNKTNK